MSFNIALSGLSAASTDLEVTSNNIANVSTTGFKESRAEFADIYAVSALGSGRNTIGSGVLLSSVSQQFNQGNLTFTDNTLDLAVSGDGFFVLSPNPTTDELIYSRAGAFRADANGTIINSAGQVLRAFPVNEDGTPTTTSLNGTVPLQIPDSVGSPQATTEVDINVSLPANGETETGATTFDPTDPATFNRSTSVTIFDSQGNPHIANVFFRLTNDINNTWETRVTVDGTELTPNDIDASGDITGDLVLDFDASGNLDATNSSNAGLIGFQAFPLTNGAAPFVLNFDFRSQGVSATQEVNGAFSVQSLAQDGFTTGRLSGLEIADDGIVRANFTNGQALALGKIALARFDNPQGLRQIGNTNWSETLDSGEALAGEAGTGSFGLVQSGALEASNVDLTAELVQLITAQRNFQASSKAIETSNTVTQTIININ